MSLKYNMREASHYLGVTKQEDKNFSNDKSSHADRHGRAGSQGECRQIAEQMERQEEGTS